MPDLSTAKKPCETPAQDCNPEGFYQQVPAYRLTYDLDVDPKVSSRVYQKLRAAEFHIAELEGLASKPSGGSNWKKLMSVDAERDAVVGEWLLTVSW